MAKKTPSDGIVKARALLITHVDGEAYPPDAVISAPAAVIKQLEAHGFVDSDEDAVAYAESLV